MSNKTIALFAGLTVLAALHCQPPKTTDDPLNLGFEKTDASLRPEKWSITNPSGFYRSDHQFVQHGEASLSISAGGDSLVPYSAYQDISVPVKGDSIVFRGFLKTDNVNKGDASFYFWVRDDQGNLMSALVTRERTRISGTTDWKEYRLSLPLSPAAATIRIGVMLYGPGKLWADDLHLDIDGAPYDLAKTKFRPLIKTSGDPDVISAARALPHNPDAVQIQRLADLGQLWSFLKYHAAYSVYPPDDCDSRLFESIPKLMSAKSETETEQVYIGMIGSFLHPGQHPQEAAPFDPLAINSVVPTGGEAKTVADYGNLFAAGHFSASIRRRLDSIRRNDSPPVNPYVQFSALGNPVFKTENLYGDEAYPNAAIRLLSLYRYWEIIQYYYPYRALFNGTWTDALAEFIPDILGASDSRDFAKTFMKVIAKVADSHASLYNRTVLDSVQGTYLLPLHTDFIENKLVITKVDNSSIPGLLLRPGDIIEAIDDVPVSDLVQKYLPLTAGSNLPFRLSALSGSHGLLLRSSAQEGTITVKNNSGLAKYRFHRVDSNGNGLNKRVIDKPAFELIGDIGYINPSKLVPEDLGRIKPAFNNTRGIVIDLRCYPSTFMPFTYGAWLKGFRSPFAQFTKMDSKVPGRIIDMGLQENGAGDADVYKGKLVMLVNANTISQAEYTTMAFQSVPGALVVGSETNGADGDVSSIDLPGQIKTMISGLGVYYPDGGGTQRTGVRIDIPCSPTIKGIREGRDELLEKGIEAIGKVSGTNALVSKVPSR